MLFLFSILSWVFVTEILLWSFKDCRNIDFLPARSIWFKSPGNEIIYFDFVLLMGIHFIKTFFVRELVR